MSIQSTSESLYGLRDCPARCRRICDGVQHDKIMNSAEVPRAGDTHVGFAKFSRISFAFVAKNVTFRRDDESVRHPPQLINRRVERRRRGNFTIYLVWYVRGPIILHGLLRQSRALCESSVGTGFEICTGYRIEEDLKTYPRASTLLAEQRCCGGDISTAAITDDSDARSVKPERGGIFGDIPRRSVCLLNGNRKSALGGPAKFDDHDCRTYADGKLAGEAIMGTCISEGPPSPVEEHDDRQAMRGFRYAN